MTSQDESDIRHGLANAHHGLKAEMAGMRDEMTDFRQEFDDFSESVALEFKDVRQELGDFKESVALELQDVKSSVAAVDMRCRRQGVLMEALQSSVKQIAQGLLSLQDQMKTNRQERAAQMSHLESLLRVSYSGLKRRVSKLEEISS